MTAHHRVFDDVEMNRLGFTYKVITGHCRVQTASPLQNKNAFALGRESDIVGGHVAAYRVKKDTRSRDAPSLFSLRL